MIEDMTCEQAAQTLGDTFDKLGLTVAINGPRPGVRDNWPCISYTVEFGNGKTTIEADFHMGIGHVNWQKRPVTLHLTDEEWAALNTMKAHPCAMLKDKHLEARIAAKLARNQGVKPNPAEVLARLCEEGLEARGQTFEEWADNLGYDKDSRKAEAIYKACADNYLKVSQILSYASMEELAELSRML